MLTRITVLGAAYLTVVCLLPDYVMAQTGQQQFFVIGGTSLLILVNVTVDTISQIQSASAGPPIWRPAQEGEAQGGPRSLRPGNSIRER